MLGAGIGHEAEEHDYGARMLLIMTLCSDDDLRYALISLLLYVTRVYYDGVWLLRPCCPTSIKESEKDLGAEKSRIYELCPRRFSRLRSMHVPKR